MCCSMSLECRKFRLHSIRAVGDNAAHQDEGACHVVLRRQTVNCIDNSVLNNLPAIVVSVTNARITFTVCGRIECVGRYAVLI
jgi:hypothetical protein